MAQFRAFSPLPPLIPPFRYCVIEEGVYRGAHPSLKNMRFMRRLKLRAVLSLVPEAKGPSKDLKEYCEAENIRLKWYKVDKYDDGFSHTPQLVAYILNELVDPHNHPVYIHCRDGSHNTGLVVMCLRRLQNWSLPTIYEEFTRYTKSNAITFQEKQFVESFHAKVKLPVEIPLWLWEGVRHSAHPSIHLELERDANKSNHSLGSPLSGNSRDADFYGQVLSPRGKNQDQCSEEWISPTHKQVQMHYTMKLASLDLCGVHFADCCKPDIDGHPVKKSDHDPKITVL